MNNAKNVVLFILILAVLLMGYGYHVLLQKLSNSKNPDVSNETWQVEITQIRDKSLLGSAEVLKTPTFTKNTAQLQSIFKYKEDSIIYEMTIQNKGSIDAKIDSIQLLPTSTKRITYAVSNVTPGITILRAGETKTFDVTVAYHQLDHQESLDVTNQVDVILTYAQANI